jgi:RND family efflux transporter MFP subunit
MHVVRIRALYADSAAPKAQLDDAESALARADAGVRAARGAVAEVEAARAYAEVRAPFDGTITKRFVDPGSFVTMGAPLIAIEDASRLRLSVTVTPSDARAITPGTRLDARIENQPASAVVEGVVPAAGSALFTLNAVIENASGRLLAGSSGTLLLPRANHTGILLPEAALVHDGDLTGTRVRAANGTLELRWLQVSRVDTGHVEVLSGLRSGETVALDASTTRMH